MYRRFPAQSDAIENNNNLNDDDNDTFRPKSTDTHTHTQHEDSENVENIKAFVLLRINCLCAQTRRK